MLAFDDGEELSGWIARVDAGVLTFGVLVPELESVWHLRVRWVHERVGKRVIDGQHDWLLVSLGLTVSLSVVMPVLFMALDAVRDHTTWGRDLSVRLAS
ncbi:hypothetical protein BST46_29080, partial [Mycobacterium timonense]